ncbi:hypothetical protein ACP4OV_014752 [Aristida adscensionis]
MTRNWHPPSLFKSSMWLAYLGSDALAIYALSTLFNRHKTWTGAGTMVQLEVLWAPVLLFHLGGLHAVTAYSIEDNELWGRHLVTLVSQVTVALYVFCRSSSSGDKRLLQAATLLFIAGILKFLQKPLALRAASFNRLLSSDVVYPQQRVKTMFYMVLLFLSCRMPDSVENAASRRKEEERDLSLEELAIKPA